MKLPVLSYYSYFGKYKVQSTNVTMDHYSSMPWNEGCYCPIQTLRYFLCVNLSKLLDMQALETTVKLRRISLTSFHSKSNRLLPKQRVPVVVAFRS